MKKFALISLLLLPSVAGCGSFAGQVVADVGIQCGLGGSLNLADVEASMIGGDLTWANEKPVLEKAGIAALVCIVKTAITDLSAKQAAAAKSLAQSENTSKTTLVNYTAAIARGQATLEQYGVK